MDITISAPPLLTEFRSVEIPDADWEELTACPVCRAAEFVRDVAVVTAVRPAGLFAVCTDCEHGFMRRRPSADWFTRFYSSHWDAKGRKDVETGCATLPQPNLRVVDFCRDELPPESAVLDIGAGYGQILLGFRKAGHRVYAMEMSAHRAARLRAAAISTWTDQLGNFTVPEPVGLACMHHVLEHVADPRQAIHELRQQVRPGGLVYIAVPDFWLEFPPFGLHFIPHLSWFTTRSLARLYALCGLNPVKQEIGKDIQMVAVATGAGADESSTQTSREQFWDRVTKHICDPFGNRTGPHTVVWVRAYDDPSSHWSWRTTPGSSLFAWLAFHARRYGRLRRLWVRYLPHQLKGDPLCVLQVSVRGERRLPVIIRHATQDQTVWVK